MDKRKINLEEILFTEADKLRKDFPFLDLYSNKEMKESPEWKYFMSAMKEACRQILELAAENAEIDYVPDYQGGEIAYINENSILDTIKQIK